MFDKTNRRRHAVSKGYQKAIGRHFFLEYAKFVYPELIVARHHIYMARRLDAFMKREVRFLMFALPPRHTKSLFCSVLYPGFTLGRDPKREIIHASYAASLSNGFSRDVRTLIRDNERYRFLFPGTALSMERQRQDDWETSAGGGFKSIGVGGGITGHGGDPIIIDDPQKEGEDLSPGAMKNIFTWYNSAIRLRLSPGGGILLPMTRWHAKDICGRLLAIMAGNPSADQWEVVKFTALALENDLLGRVPGAALWPERYSVEHWHAVRAISERYFEALCQQNPMVSSQPLFVVEDFKRQYDLLVSDFERTFWSFDLASTDTERSDYNVFARWGWSAGRRKLGLLEVRRFRAQWPEVKKRLREIVRGSDEPMYFPDHVLELLSLQELRSEFPDRRHRFKKVVMPGDKVARAASFSDLVKCGNVVVNYGHFDLGYFISEHCDFPDEGDHDDCVDASSVATHALGLHKEFMVRVIQIGENKRFNPLEELGF